MSPARFGCVIMLSTRLLGAQIEGCEAERVPFALFTPHATEHLSFQQNPSVIDQAREYEYCRLKGQRKQLCEFETADSATSLLAYLQNKFEEIAMFGSAMRCAVRPFL